MFIFMNLEFKWCEENAWDWGLCFSNAEEQELLDGDGLETSGKSI